MKRTISLVFVLLILFGSLVFIGCQRQQGAAGTTSTPVGQYPVNAGDTVLKYWLNLHGNISPNYTNFGDTPLGQELTRQTGIRVEYEHPTTGTVAEAFNLLVASGFDMPDIIEYNWLTVPGGPERYIGDNVIIALNDVVEQYAPNLRNLLRDRPDFNRMVRTDEGNLYVFPFIRGHEDLLYSQGMMVRKDILDRLNIAEPETMDDWYRMLVAFRNDGAQAPFSMPWSNRGRMFMPGFGFLNEFYMDHQTNEIRYGNIHPNYRQWVETMARWYREGLIDADLMTITGAQHNQKMITGGAYATVGSLGGGLGVWTAAARVDNPTYELVALQYPVLNRGETLVYTIPNQPYNGADSAAITVASRNAELAARFLDWGYTTQGNLNFNFGVEGTSYTMVSNFPTFTPWVMQGAGQGWPVAQALGAHVRSTAGGPFVQDQRYIRQFYELPEQYQGLRNYVLPGAINYFRPPITATPNESQELATIMQAINTYVAERTSRWILGTEVLNDASWNNYITTVNSMGIARAIELENAALRRYMARQ